MSLLVDIEKKLGAFTLHAQFETSGGIMALLGASGSDKSVTLKCITGIMTPDRGRIVLDGKTLFDSEARVNLTPQQRRVGYLFQQYALFPNMTVMQNILCGVRSGTKAERRRKVQDSLRRFRLEGLEKKYPAQFSGGQQQRVAPDQLPEFSARARLRRRCGAGRLEHRAAAGGAGAARGRRHRHRPARGPGASGHLRPEFHRVAAPACRNCRRAASACRRAKGRAGAAGADGSFLLANRQMPVL